MHRSALRIVATVALAALLAAPAAAAPRGGLPLLEARVPGLWQTFWSWLSGLAPRLPPSLPPVDLAKEGPGWDPNGLADAGEKPPRTTPACGFAACTDEGPEWDPEGTDEGPAWDPEG